ERVAPPAFGEQLVKYLRYRIHNLTVLADFLADLLEAEAKREREVREVQEKREREIEKRWGRTPERRTKRRPTPTPWCTVRTLPGRRWASRSSAQSTGCPST